MITKEQEVIVRIIRELKLEQRQLANLYLDLAERAEANPNLFPLLDIVRIKQFALTDKIFNLGQKEFSIAEMIRALQERTKFSNKVQTRLLELVIEELKEIIEILQDIAAEEQNLFNLFLRAAQNESTQLMQEISFKESSLAFKFGALGFKQFTMAEKIRAILNINPNGNAIADILEKGFFSKTYEECRTQIKERVKINFN
ncbi:hypothetical protein SYNTR_1165 [Candidatus Syntrophocurvum alkaliphilum]|uniref:Uncharacterized protein n=1 Tax=Candidatus Syntrophocurvum alkaliphilum TaxID=2293317 RepID=A0A6I6DAA4_9FIRM|nr:hypothetical protein [Candidatus Syntrophocurvum alkaliphilum]QGT99758.1 hypothetical protein SYNTR_1165 [Candidatus Syntrophocurvum alkaliphilum]